LAKSIHELPLHSGTTDMQRLKSSKGTWVLPRLGFWYLLSVHPQTPIWILWTAPYTQARICGLANDMGQNTPQSRHTTGHASLTFVAHGLDPMSSRRLQCWHFRLRWLQSPRGKENSFRCDLLACSFQFSATRALRIPPITTNALPILPVKCIVLRYDQENALVVRNSLDSKGHEWNDKRSQVRSLILTFSCWCASSLSHLTLSPPQQKAGSQYVGKKNFKHKKPCKLLLETKGSVPWTSRYARGPKQTSKTCSN